MAIQELIDQLLVPELIDKGMSDELGGRTVLVLARDQLLLKHNTKEPMDFGFARHFLVSSFLAALLSTKIQLLVPEEIKRFLSGWANFTHFVTIDRSLVSDTMPSVVNCPVRPQCCADPSGCEGGKMHSDVERMKLVKSIA
ncbi:hypothetical protein BDD12DRAFT_887803 [Trichophaea hybrida]|nr:hypothetical protein BDD12DRAFT_887803 [Trichophaea hybrida]